MLLTILPAALLLLLLPMVSAQFQFFEQMFQGNQQQQPQSQNMGSDSAWYQAQYEGGAHIVVTCDSIRFTCD